MRTKRAAVVVLAIVMALIVILSLVGCRPQPYHRLPPSCTTHAIESKPTPCPSVAVPGRG